MASIAEAKNESQEGEMKEGVSNGGEEEDRCEVSLPPGRHGLNGRMAVVNEPGAAFHFLAEKLLINLL